jgi:hypothetical protein
MIARCTNPNDKDYQNVGAKGIKVYEPWKDISEFVKDVGFRPEGTFLSRLDPSKDFEPSNVTWKTKVSSRTSEMYGIWKGMKDRSSGGSKCRGNYLRNDICVCDAWMNSEDSFYQFCLDMGPRPSKKHSIERIDNLKGYSPDNCKWALPKEQGNNKSPCHFVEFNGERKTIAQWAEAVGLSHSAMDYRLRTLLSTPSRTRQRKVIQYTLAGVKLVEYPSIKQAAEATGIKRGTLQKCLSGGNASAGGFKWSYVN